MTSKAQHTAALVDHVTRTTPVDGARLEVLEAVAALGGDETPPEWAAHLAVARDVADRRAERAAAYDAPAYDDVEGNQ